MDYSSREGLWCSPYHTPIKQCTNEPQTEAFLQQSDLSRVADLKILYLVYTSFLNYEESYLGSGPRLRDCIWRQSCGQSPEVVQSNIWQETEFARDVAKLF